MSDYRTSENARLALQHRLYVTTWSLKGTLEFAMARPELFYVGLYHVGGVPVAVMVIQHKTTARKHRNVLGVQMFVRSKYRRRGIGGALLSEFVDPHPTRIRKICANKGVDGSSEFWRANGIEPWFRKPNQPASEWEYL